MEVVVLEHLQEMFYLQEFKQFKQHTHRNTHSNKVMKFSEGYGYNDLFVFIISL